MDYDGVYWYEFLVLVPFVTLPLCIWWFHRSAPYQDGLAFAGTIGSSCALILSIAVTCFGMLQPNANDDDLCVQYLQRAPDSHCSCSPLPFSGVEVSADGEVIFPYAVRRKTMKYLRNKEEATRLQKIHCTIFKAENED